MEMEETIDALTNSTSPSTFTKCAFFHRLNRHEHDYLIPKFIHAKSEWIRKISNIFDVVFN